MLGYLLGDSAYPLSSWLMTPYKDNGHLSEKQRNYNFLHSSTRMAIERAFALLKGRFRRLKYVDIDRLEDVPDIILAACTLHNICIMSENDIEHFVDSDDDNQEADGIDGLDEDGVEENNSIGNADGSRINIGKRKRDLIAEQLWEHCRVLT
ncbi:putative nuclease HARBI1 [Corticium candelabrum]|uniref:putative nuclease HARBI1 n=1 Tax=Corticium candelabrum TaxID=121492 RepID=UPI002E266F35|nr:putative nuclease HARBI1 [Corticium candelabrum]